MTSFVYSENIKNSNFVFDPLKVDPVKQYEKHFENLLYLDYIASSPLSSFSERHQAEKEMIIARRKMKYWKKYVDIAGLSIQSTVEQAKRKWKY